MNTELNDKTFFVMGVANKKSVATFTANILINSGAKVIFSAQNETNLKNINKLFPASHAFICDVESPEDMAKIPNEILGQTKALDGFLHSIAFANFEAGPIPFHETTRRDYLQACQISCFSLTEVTNLIKDILSPAASIVTVSISNTKATSYGYLGPIKAMLESSVAYLAKSLSGVGSIRVNSIGAGPLKTSASAGIPNYIENYLYSEALTLRKKSLATSEVANTICFLLSPLSSGINAQNIIVDAGMGANYFDQDIVKSLKL